MKKAPLLKKASNLLGEKLRKGGKEEEEKKEGKGELW